jgi:hypothetical protein
MTGTSDAAIHFIAAEPDAGFYGNAIGRSGMRYQ